MRINFSLLFYLKKPKNYQTGLVPVYLRVTVNGKRTEITTGRECDPSAWNTASGRLNGTKKETKSFNANTLTIATTGVISSVPVYIRFTPATAVGTYSGNVMLSSTGAQNINMAIPASIVNPTPLTIIANDASKTYGSTITNSPNSTAFSIAAGALKNGNTITSVNLTYGAGAAANSGVGTYLSVSPTINTIGNGFLRSNYNITYYMGNIVVTSAPLTIAANSINKPNGTALATTTTFTAFAATGLQNQETIGSVVLNYGAGSAMTDPAGLYQGSVVPSSPSGGTFSVSNYNITYINGDITVEPQIAILASGTLGSLSTTYGTASRSTSFTVSGTNLSANILVAPPAGFEVSTDNIQFYPIVTIGTGGNIASTLVYIRLAALTAVGNYVGNIFLSSAGITNTSLVMPQSTVITTPLTITADNKSKIFGTNNPNLTVSYSGFVNKETVVVINTLPAITTIASKASAVGQYAITASGAISPNYGINYVQGALTITPLPISIVIPNTFTPNGDGFNDIWNIPALAFYSNNNVSVFDKSGTRVFYSLGYGNPWDGNYNGSKLPLGTYYYIIMVDMSKKIETLSGSVTIIR